MGNKSSTPEEKHKRDLEERGVLIPPVFGVGNEHSWEAFNPSLFVRIEQDSLSHRLLHQHLYRGVWISSQTNPAGTVLASLVPLVPSLQDSKKTGTAFGNFSRNTWSEQQSLLRVSQQLGDTLAVQLFYHSHQSSNLATTFHLAPNVKLCSSLDAQGIGWWSAQYRTSVRNYFLPPIDASSTQQYYRNNPFSKEADESNKSNRRLQLHFGSWLDIDASNHKNWSKLTAIGENLLSSIPAAHAYASLQVPGCLLAVQGKLPTNNYETLPEVSYYITCDLTGNNSNSNSPSPPLAATIRKSGQSSSMALSQVLTWDRYSINALEVRCPKIRNSLAWTVALEKVTASAAATPKAAMAWQLNRAVALKAVAQTDGMRGAIVFKRWKQPRITCACLVGTSQFGGLEFQGLGVTLEIGGGADSNAAHQGVEYNDSQTINVSPLVPETKATLPK